MTADDAIHRCQTHAGAGEFVLPVQALEGLKQLVGIVRVETDAVVADEEGPLSVRRGDGSESNGREIAARTVFPRIRQQVLHRYAQQRAISRHFDAGLDLDSDL